MKRTRKEWWLDLVKGTSLGMGMIPGVSAGTMAILVGIYDRLIGGIASLRKDFINSFVLLFPMGIGTLLSIIICTIGVHFGEEYLPLGMICFFAGITIGCLPIITKEVKGQKRDEKGVSLFVIGAVFAAGIGLLSSISKIYWNLDFSKAFIAGDVWVYPVCLIAGFIAAAGCIVPGISGAMILYVFGLYQPIVQIFVGDNSILHNHDRLPSALLIIAFVFVGAVLGLILTSKAMKSLLEKKRARTFEVVLGFIVGSIVAMFINQNVVLDDLTWVYQSTPVWEYIVGAVLLLSTSVGFYLFTREKK